MKPWCRLRVKSGSGSSRNHDLRALVTLLMSDDHSSASRFTASRSINKSRVRKLGTSNDRTSVQLFLQLCDLACGSINPIDTLRSDTIFFDSLTTFLNYRRKFDIVSCHLLGQVNPKCRLVLLWHLRVWIIWCTGVSLSADVYHGILMRWYWGQLRDTTISGCNGQCTAYREEITAHESLLSGTFPSWASWYHVPMSIGIVLHICLEVRAIINRLDGSLEAKRSCIANQPSSMHTTMHDSPSSRVRGTSVDPSPKIILSNKNAYRVRWYCVPRSTSSAHSFRAWTELITDRSTRRQVDLPTFNILGNWKLKYSCLIACVSIIAFRYASEALETLALTSSSCRWICSKLRLNQWSMLYRIETNIAWIFAFQK